MCMSRCNQSVIGDKGDKDKVHDSLSYTYVHSNGGDSTSEEMDPVPESHPFVGTPIQRLLVVSTHEDGNGLNTKVGDDVDGSVFGSSGDGLGGVVHGGQGRDFTRRITLPIKLHGVQEQVLFIAAVGRGSGTQLSSVLFLPRRVSNADIVVVTVFKWIRRLPKTTPIINHSHNQETNAFYKSCKALGLS